MALQHSVTIDETTYPEAYSRLMYVLVNYNRAYPFVNTYATREARLADEAPIKQQEFQMMHEALVGDTYPLAYAYLKTLPEFAGAIDVFEPADGPPADSAPGAA